MPRFISSSAVRSDSAQGLKNWVQLTHDAMIAAGCVQTSDTGQIVIDNITEPSTGNYDLGFRVYELNDSLSSSKPIYIKIRFMPRRQSNTTSELAVPCCAVWFMSETDGAGNSVGGYYSTDYMFNALTVTSGSIAYQSNSGNFAGKKDGYLTLGIGINCCICPANSYPTACFFVLKRINSNGDFAIFSPTNFSGARGGNRSDIKCAVYSYTSKSVVNTANSVFLAAQGSIIGGIAYANPAQIATSENLLSVYEFVCFPISAFSANSIISLSTDGIVSHDYYVIPISTVATTIGFLSVPDSRNPLEFGLAVRV